MKNDTPLWCEAHFQVKINKTPQGGTDFASSDVKKWHAPVARSTFASQNIQKTSVRDRFWKFRCPKTHFQVKINKTPQGGTDFASSDVKKWHAPVARSTFASQNIQKTSVRDRFWKFRCPKITRRCGAKRIFKSECAKHTCLDHFLKVRCPKIARRCGAQRICKSKCTNTCVLRHFERFLTD